jgi:transposase
MRWVDSFAHVFLYRQPVDMRRGRSGLASLVTSEMAKSLYDNHLFLFLNRSQTILKMLYWDRNGFAIWSKTLEKESYRWPRKLFVGEVLELSPQKVSLLLEGVDVALMREHQTLVFSEEKC